MLRSKHKECDEQHSLSQDKIRQAVVECIQTRGNASRITSAVLPLARQGFVRSNELADLVVAGWGLAVDAFLDDGLLSSDEESKLINFAEHSGLNHRLQQHPGYTQIAKAVQLRDLSEGKINSRMDFNGALPVNLQKNEKLIWAFPNTEYLEDRERREFSGVSHGVSIRVMTGVHYRLGLFKGRPVTKQERVSLGLGTLFVTTKHIYFAGGSKPIRIPFTKIVSFDQFSDGIGIMQEAASAKPQTFITHDGWFTFNLIARVSQL
jgi:hypothetical protein